MDVVRSRNPAWLADPIALEQLAARLLGSLPEYGPQSRHRVDEFVARFIHVLSSLAAICSRFLPSGVLRGREEWHLRSADWRLLDPGCQHLALSHGATSHTQKHIL